MSTQVFYRPAGRGLNFRPGLLALMLVWASVAPAEPVVFRSGPEQVSLLELYTSEGCSSCPPAEAWLTRLTNSPGLWTDFAPVAFHVDYWNDTGWRDPWSAPEFTERQRAFARLWRSQNYYTPEFVLNGREWQTWSSQRGFPPRRRAYQGVLEISSTNHLCWSVSFQPAAAGGEYQIHLALLAGGLSSQVRAGENRGRTLEHEFAALELAQARLATSNGMARGKCILDAPRPAPETNLALTAWVTRPGEMTPLQATGGWLFSPAKK
jgi:hypothetical protein